MDSRTIIAGCVAVFITGAAAAQTSPPAAGSTPRDATAPNAASGTLKDAIELCARLAGTEREICLQQARENRERALAPGVGATPGDSGPRSTSEQPRGPSVR